MFMQLQDPMLMSRQDWCSAGKLGYDCDYVTLNSELRHSELQMNMPARATQPGRYVGLGR